MQSTQTATALHALLDSLIDYAGLFPPAGLGMHAAVENFSRYKTGPYSWMLGRFVVPVARLTEFEEAWRNLGKPEGWQLSGLVTKPEAELPVVDSFNTKHKDTLRIDAIESKASTPTEIRALPAQITTYVEIPSRNNPTELIATIKAAGLRAKIRTGGLTEDMFPDAATIARFLRSCAAAGVPLKATAGLHHPVRCVKPFTYEADSARGPMHGFLNVFLAAGFARQGHPQAFVERLLLEENGNELKFSDQGVQWRGAELTASEIIDLRARFAIAFGSCSFEEPIADLQALGLLP